MREFSTSWTVIGSRNIAFGFRAAQARVATAISANCSLVVPYCAMWREQARAYEPTGRGRPKGSSNWPDRLWGLVGRGGIPTRERPLSPWLISATLHSPLAIAVTAWPTWMTKDEPPTAVQSVYLG